MKEEEEESMRDVLSNGSFALKPWQRTALCEYEQYSAGKNCAFEPAP